MKVFTPPTLIPIDRYKLTIFLGGTIDMGISVNWQDHFISKYDRTPFVVYNPRRSNWDANWKQHYENPQFFQQVSWELDAMEKAKVIIINFLPTSKSPISLLELGLFAKSGKVYVCCPDEYYRSGNINIVCSRFGIPLFKDMDELMQVVCLDHGASTTPDDLPM